MELKITISKNNPLNKKYLRFFIEIFFCCDRKDNFRGLGAEEAKDLEYMTERGSAVKVGAEAVRPHMRQKKRVDQRKAGQSKKHSLLLISETSSLFEHLR